MPDLLTTDEAAAYLRLSERKLYELVANAAVPCTKLTGKWLFPKAALERWLAAGLLTPPSRRRGQAFIDRLVSAEGQKAIADYKINGRELFFPNANAPGA